MAKRLAVSGPVSGAPPEVRTELALPGPIAGLGARSLAFLVDSIVLMAFTLVFAALALVNLLVRSDFGEATPSDSAIVITLAIVIATLPAWLLVNLVLARRRGQSVGHYVLGLLMVREDGGSVEASRHLLRLLALHPVIFHPLLAFSWAALAVVSVSLAHNAELLIASVALCALFFLAPLVAFVSAALDGGRRCLHDRIAGTVVVRLD